MSPGRCITVTISNSVSVAADDNTTTVVKKIFIGGMEIIQPHQFVYDTILVHGIEGFITSFSCDDDHALKNKMSSAFPFHTLDEATTVVSPTFIFTPPLVTHEYGSNMLPHYRKILAAPTFHHYTLALLWAPGVCMSQSCIPQVSRLFTVHGLWPSNIKWPQPSGCTLVHYFPTDIDSLKPDLRTAWPDIGGADEAFWKREWEKHGICSPFSQYDYFRHTLYLWYTYNVTAMLEEQNIRPGGTYDYQRIKTTISAKTSSGSAPHITCAADKYLAEIHLCLDAATAMKIVSCPSAHTHCQTNMLEFAA